MSKVKQWAEDTAMAKILDVDNVNMLGIDENNVDEVIMENA